MSESNILKLSLANLEGDYEDAAAELQSRQANLLNYAAELDVFIKSRDELKAYPEFSGALPETFFSGSALDPDGVSGKQGHTMGESGPTNWT